MKAPRTELPLLYLQPGELYFSETPVRVATVLGSCVSVTMYCARLVIGSICHILLPRCRRKACIPNCEDAFRYADCSIKAMIAWFIDKGAYPAELEVKVFGGSDILVTGPDRRNVSVGKQNIEAARQALLREGLKLHASHIGGTSGRKIIFSTQTGEVLMKRIRKTVHIEEDLCRRQALKQEY